MAELGARLTALRPGQPVPGHQGAGTWAEHRQFVVSFGVMLYLLFFLLRGRAGTGADNPRGDSAGRRAQDQLAQKFTTDPCPSGNSIVVAASQARWAD